VENQVMNLFGVALVKSRSGDPTTTTLLIAFKPNKPTLLIIPIGFFDL
jgi:hypothetical protein